MPLKQKHKNNLFLVRKKKAFAQKQIASLFGHKTTDQISRYERGVKLPSLKIALKLQIIYHVPVHILFYGYYESCLKEIKKQGKKHKAAVNDLDLSEGELLGDTEFCTFVEKLKAIKVKNEDLDKARSHIAKLIRTRGEKMNHY